MRNIILVVLDSVRRDFFYRNINNDFNELRKDFVDFRNCHSIYTATCVSHYTIFFGDYFGKSKNESFPAQLRKFRFKTRSFCNGAIITGYPIKEIEEENIKNNRPFRDKMIKDLGISPEFDWKKGMFGSNFEDYYGTADDEDRNVSRKWKDYLCKNKKEKNFIFLHFWKAHYNYGINEYLKNCIKGNNYKVIGRELIRRVKNREITESFVKNIYSKRINELINTYLKDLVNILKENKIYDDSLIIITADHGEGLGDIGEDYNETFFNVYKTFFRHYDSLRKRVIFLPKMKKRYYKWDFETFYHNGNHELQKEIPLLIKFPNNEFGGKKYEKKVTLFDIIYTIDDFVGNKLDIKENYESSLYTVLTLGNRGKENELRGGPSLEEEEKMKERLRDLGYQ